MTIKSWLALVLIAAASPPARLQISTDAGVTRITLLQHPEHGPLVPLGALARGVGGSVLAAAEWFTLQSPAGQFRFLAGSPVLDDGVAVRGMPASTVRRGDSLFVPLAFVSDVLAEPARRAWSWNPVGAVLTQGPTVSLLSASPAGPPAPRVGSVRPTSGARPVHHVTIDAGHGGTDPGNPGLYFPNGLKEKHVTLAVSLQLRDELERRGVRVTMTRTRDTLINLAHRAPRYCRDDCDLFVSLHVNSLNPRPGSSRVRGFETFFLAEARTEDAARVARMENDAIRYETVSEENNRLTGLEFILKDLQTNEFLRESGRAAELVQSHLREVHDGPDRGVKQAGFAVLTTARRPSILIEMGYSTNPEDARLMTTRIGQASLASAIAEAVVAYLREFDRKTGDSVRADG